MRHGSGIGPLVVIPCLNEEAHLPDLLCALASDVSASDQMIVVADGGSTDRSREIVLAWTLRMPNLVLMNNPARLQSAGVNLAVSRFGADRRFLVRVDAHAAYPKDFVTRLVGTAETHGAESVVVPLLTQGAGCFQKAVATAQNSPIGTGGAAHRLGRRRGWVDHGHHALMRIDRFVSLGGYHSDFSHNEDAEYDLRLTQAGGRVWLEPDLAVGYFPRTTPAALFRQYRNYGRGRARTVRLHQTPLKLRQALPLLVLPSVIAAGIAAVAAPIAPVVGLLAVPAALWTGASLAGGALAAYKSGGERCSWGAGFAAMIMHLGWSVGFWSEQVAGRPIQASVPAEGPAPSLP